jgi:hypothetical protein
VRFFVVRAGLALTSSPATEAQAFSLKTPELFFDLYSPPRKELKARERLEQILRFAGKRVSSFHAVWHAVAI